MELNEKLQELRKQKNLTQEELAEFLCVSRTAISKWESGRGYPNIDSLKAIAKYFSVTVDELLSGDEMLTIAQEEQKQKERHMRDLVFGLLDCSVILFLFLPFFGQGAAGGTHGVSMLALTGIAPYLRTAYFAIVIAMAGWGLLTLALQNCSVPLRAGGRERISILLHVVGELLLIVSRQPYAAALLFVFLMIKASLLVKKP